MQLRCNLETPGNSEADILLNLSMTDGLVRSCAAKGRGDILDTSKEQPLDLMTLEEGGDDAQQKRGGPDDTLTRGLMNTVAKVRGKRAFLAQQGDCFNLEDDDLMTGRGGVIDEYDDRMLRGGRHWPVAPMSTEEMVAIVPDPGGAAATVAKVRGPQGGLADCGGMSEHHTDDRGDVLGAVGDDIIGGGAPAIAPPDCAYNDGVCGVHGPATKKWRPSKVWTKKPNGLFGWKYTRHVYYTCTGKTPSTAPRDVPVQNQEPEPSFLVLGSASREVLKRGLVGKGRRGKQAGPTATLKRGK